LASSAIGFTGTKARALRALRPSLMSPSDDTAVIQQIHLTALHGIATSSSARS